MRLASTCLALLALSFLGIVACSTEGVLGSLEKDAADAGSPEASLETGGEGGAVAPVVPSTAAIAAGGASTCVRTAQGEELCWGENRTGSLGIGDVDPSTSATPVSPTPLGKVQALAAGQTAQCALTRAGKVYCWGDLFVGDFSGQTFDHIPAASPLPIDEAGPVAQMAVGRYFTCFLSPAGDVRCLGLNDHGQLGVGSTDAKHLPTTLTGFDGAVTSISASMGGLFACATTSPGSVYCWGDNASGQIVEQVGDVTSPQKVQGLAEGERAVQVVAGKSHVCVRLASGTVKCWGNGVLGQLGDGLSSSSSNPVEVLYLSDVVTLAAGASHTCAVRREGSVFCWGNDQDGQAGKSPDPSRPFPAQPASFGAQHASCGLAHSCAWGTGGRVACWGSDASFQLGPRDTTF